MPRVMLLGRGKPNATSNTVELMLTDLTFAPTSGVGIISVRKTESGDVLRPGFRGLEANLAVRSPSPCSSRLRKLGQERRQGGTGPTVIGKEKTLGPLQGQKFKQKVRACSGEGLRGVHDGRSQMVRSWHSPCSWQLQDIYWYLPEIISGRQSCDNLALL